MMTFQEFVEYYQANKRLPLGMYTSQKEYTPRKLKMKYEDYQKKAGKQESYSLLRESVLKRDSHTCRGWLCLNPFEQEILSDYVFGDFADLEVAHIVGRGRNPALREDPKNMVALSKYFHDCMDKYRDPITNHPMTEEDRDRWWIRIVGEDLYTKLNS